MSLQAPELTYEVTSWQPGFLDSADPTQLPLGSTPSARNCFPRSVGPDGRCTLGKRNGATIINQTGIGAATKIDAIYEFLREGVATGQLLVASDTHLWRWDGATSFTDLGNIGAAVGGPITFATFRNVAFVMDGSIIKAYDASTLYDVGFVAPTAPPALAAGGGVGLTGTYQSLATWYDQTHDHESSPTTGGTAVALVNQDRAHTKPAGAPPARVTHWRVYVRRTDTNELYYKLVATVPIGTAATTETVSDTARNLASNLLAPLPNENDTPPVFAFMAAALGYRFGVQPSDSYVWVSKLGDPESQHPKDKIAVARGDGQGVTTIKAVGTTLVVQKARRTWYLKGDRMPFVPVELSPSFGNQSQSSSVDANGLYWAWDSESGPYVTDLAGTWQSLADGQIDTFLATVNKAAPIRCVHDKDRKLVIWLVATGASTHTATMLAYSYQLKAWLPPMTGLDYASAATFASSLGQSDLYVGDYYGRVFRYFTGDTEGAPVDQGHLVFSVQTATATSVTVSNAGARDRLAIYFIAGHTTPLTTFGGALKGLQVAVVDRNDNWQVRRIINNTALAITVDSAWTVIPDDTYLVVIAPIDWFWTTPLINWQAPMRRKRGGYLYAVNRVKSVAGAGLTVRARLNDTTSPQTVHDTFSISGANAWGLGYWGAMLWGKGGRQSGRKRLVRSFYSLQIEISNRYPNEPMEVTTLGVTADPVRGRWSHG